MLFMPRIVTVLVALTIALTIGCAVPVERPSPQLADQVLDHAATLVDGWFNEIRQGEPQSEQALALHAWSFSYFTMLTSGHTHGQALQATIHDADVFADVVEVNHGEAVASAAVGYVLVRMGEGK